MSGSYLFVGVSTDSLSMIILCLSPLTVMLKTVATPGSICAPNYINGLMFVKLQFQCVVLNLFLLVGHRAPFMFHN